MNYKKIFLIIFVVISVLSFILFFYKDKYNTNTNPISVISSIPKNGSRYISEKSEVFIELNRSIKNNEYDKIKINISPDVKTETVYLENKIRIKPETNYNYGTEYIINLYYSDSIIYTLLFTTNPVTPEQFKEDAKMQMEADIAYNEAVKKIIEDFPWYTNLPIENNKFRIVYDYDKNMFRIRLLKEFSQEEINEITKESLLLIEQAGASKPIKYYILENNEEF